MQFFNEEKPSENLKYPTGNVTKRATAITRKSEATSPTGEKKRRIKL
jgi:hypothetical protein